MPSHRLVCLLLSAASAATAQVTWVQVSPMNGPQVFGPMTYDSVRQRVVMLANGLETWEWDGVVWVQRAPANSPPRFDSSSFAFDAVRGRAVLFGNQETWEWDGTTWTQMFPAVSPPSRIQAAMAWHAPSARLVLFGGSGPFQPVLGDTWTWDGTTWRRETTPVAPAPRAAAAAAYDPVRGTVLLAGGSVPSNPMFDTWSWDGSSWTPHGVTDTDLRVSHDLAFDPFRRTVVLHSFRGDTWEWTGSRWSVLAPTISPPGPRYGFGIASDTARGQVVLFGGSGFADTWILATDCRRVGAGHAEGSLPISCRTSPLLGQRLCVSFPSSQRFGMLLLGPGPCDTPFAAVDAPLFCAPGSVFAQPWVLVNSTLDPAFLCLDIPFDPSYLGLRACLQGLALQPGNCLRLTDAGETRVRLR
jgi:hypothetical protein